MQSRIRVKYNLSRFNISISIFAYRLNNISCDSCNTFTFLFPIFITKDLSVISHYAPQNKDNIEWRTGLGMKLETFHRQSLFEVSWINRPYNDQTMKKKIVDDKLLIAFRFVILDVKRIHEWYAAPSPFYFAFHRQVCNPASLRAIWWLVCWLCMRRYNTGKPQIGEKSDYKRRRQTETLIEKPVSDAV